MRKVKKQSNIQPLNNAGKNHIRYQEGQKRYNRFIHMRRRIIALIAIAAVAVFAMINVYSQHNKYTTAAAGLHETNKALTNAKQTHKDLKQEVKDLHDDNYLQKLIREKYMYTKDDEVVFNIK